MTTSLSSSRDMVNNELQKDVGDMTLFWADFDSAVDIAISSGASATISGWDASAKATVERVLDTLAYAAKVVRTMRGYLNTLSFLGVADDELLSDGAWDQIVKARDSMWQAIWEAEQRALDLMHEVDPSWDPIRFNVVPRSSPLYPAIVRGGPPVTHGFQEFNPIYRGKTSQPIQDVEFPIRDEIVTDAQDVTTTPHVPGEDRSRAPQSLPVWDQPVPPGATGRPGLPRGWTTPGLDDLPDPFATAPSRQSRDRAAIAALQGGGHGDEFFFGLGGGGNILSKLDKGGGRRGLGMGAFASITGGPRDLTTYAHGKLPGPKGPNPGPGKGTDDTKIAKGRSPSTAKAPNPPPDRSTDRGGSSDPKASAQANRPDANPATDQAGPNPSDARSSGGATPPAPPATPTDLGGGPTQVSVSAPPQPTVRDDDFIVNDETVTSAPQEPPPNPPPPKDDDRPDPEDDRGGGGGPRSTNDNPNPEDTGGGGGRGGGIGGPRAYGGGNQNPNPEDQGGGGGPRAYGGSSRSSLAGPRSYDAYPDPESTGGGGPRGRYNERPNPEDTGSPHGPSARNRSAIGPWSASRNRMI